MRLLKDMYEPRFTATLKDGTALVESDEVLYGHVSQDELAHFQIDYGVHHVEVDLGTGAVSVDDGAFDAPAPESPASLVYYKTMIGTADPDSPNYHAALTIGWRAGAQEFGVRVYPGATHEPEILSDIDAPMPEHVYEDRGVLTSE